MNKKQNKKFDEKFKTVLEWIKLNCKDEIIVGVDINHIDEILKSFIDENYIAKEDCDCNFAVRKDKALCKCSCHTKGVVNDCHYLNDNKCYSCGDEEKKECNNKHCEN